MSDEEVERLRRHYESLLKEYGEMAVTTRLHDERIDKAAEDRADIREEIKTLRLELLAAIGRSEQRTRELVNGVKESCDEGWGAWERWVDRYDKRQETAKVSNRTIVVAMIAGSATVLAAIIGATAVVLTGGG